MGWRSYLRHLDYILLAATAAIVVYGVSLVYFATRHDLAGQPLYYVSQQLQAVVVGLIAAVVISLLDYEIYRRFQWLIYAFAVFIVAVVLPLGEVVNGARRWIDLKVTSFQPSVAGAAADRAQHRRVPRRPHGPARAPSASRRWRSPWRSSRPSSCTRSRTSAPPWSSSPSPLAMLFFYGTPWTHFAVLGAAGVTLFIVALKVLPMAGVRVIQQYQIDRLFVFLNAGQNPTGSGYNIIQSMIAVGAGALSGRGDAATQTALDFLPGAPHRLHLRGAQRAQRLPRARCSSSRSTG